MSHYAHDFAVQIVAVCRAKTIVCVADWGSPSSPQE